MFRSYLGKRTNTIISNEVVYYYKFNFINLFFCLHTFKDNFYQLLKFLWRLLSLYQNAIKRFYIILEQRECQQSQCYTNIEQSQ